ncbi:hypothetical protein DOTSEDRAFT_32868 [Dothistroma septosporum NZE10]|uniref:Uncharacterized protein n=1 Tax=Dothistroma septosporum (strain NZE10 / CBS 128990) TaxID=675120 RepID=N1PS60_DOTSN|nr:hypothetical protein DOTSEDRAFT_32868 [Dothistroma septosporum NZE10]
MQSDITILLLNTQSSTRGSTSNFFPTSSTMDSQRATSNNDPNKNNSIAAAFCASARVPLGVPFPIAMFMATWYRRRWLSAERALTQLYDSRRGTDAGAAHGDDEAYDKDVKAPAEWEGAELEHARPTAEMDDATEPGYELYSDHDEGLEGRIQWRGGCRGRT